MSTRPYTLQPALRGLYLEDSFVLDIMARPGRVVFSLDLVLTPDHPAYQAPQSNEQYSYRRGQLVFLEVRELHWRSLGLRPAIDSTGEADFGGVDSYVYEGDRHILQGDWGLIEIVCSDITVALDEQRDA